MVNGERKEKFSSGSTLYNRYHTWFNNRVCLSKHVKIKKAVTNLTQEEFIQGYRKAQLIDVRETKEFDAGHILGARNVPSTQLRQRYKEIRPDLPVYLYCQNSGRSARAALFLKKKVTISFTNFKVDLKLGLVK